MLVILIRVSPWLQSIDVAAWAGKRSHSMASGVLERCSSWTNLFLFFFTVQGRWQTVCAMSCGWVVCWCRCCGPSGPWWWWGYGMSWRMFCTTNTRSIYWWRIKCTEIAWRAPEAHCCAFHPPQLLQGSVHNFRKLNTSQFLHGQLTHWTCDPFSMFGMFWIGMLDQFLPISSNFTQPLKRSGSTFRRPPSATWSALWGGDVLQCMRQMVPPSYPPWCFVCM